MFEIFRFNMFNYFPTPVNTFMGPTVYNNSFSWPIFNFNNYNFGQMFPFGFNSYSNDVGDTVKFSTPKIVTQKPSENKQDIPEVVKKYNLQDYDPIAGKKLATNALNAAIGFTGSCATYVKRAIVKSNLGEYEKGDAYKTASILRKNKNFAEISADNVNLKELPAGCVLVYDKGVAGYDKECGHTEITTGDKRAVSDGITKYLYKKPSSIFIPIKT